MELRLVGPDGREWESHEHAFSDGVIEGAEREARRWQAMKAAETPREQVTILPDPRPRTPYLLVGLGFVLGVLVAAVGFLATDSGPAQVMQPIVVQVPEGSSVSVPESSSWPLQPSTPEISVTPAPDDDAQGSPAEVVGVASPGEHPAATDSGEPAVDMAVLDESPAVTSSPGRGSAVSQDPPTDPAEPSTPAKPNPGPATPTPPPSVTPNAPEQGLVGGLLGGVGGVVDDVVCVIVCV